MKIDYAFYAASLWRPERQNDEKRAINGINKKKGIKPNKRGLSAVLSSVA